MGNTMKMMKAAQLEGQCDRSQVGQAREKRGGKAMRFAFHL